MNLLTCLHISFTNFYFNFWHLLATSDYCWRKQACLWLHWNLCVSISWARLCPPMAWLFKLRGQQCFFWLFVCVLWIKLRSFTGEWWEISVLNKLPLTLFLLLWDQLQADQVDEHLHLSSYHNFSLTDHLNQHVWSKGVRVQCEEGFVSSFSMLLNKALMMERRCQLLNSLVQ